jgi:anti-sigma regulatory factor (Ser/Thr protein kinase)
MSRDREPDVVVLDREYEGTTGTLRAARNDIVECLKDHVSDEDIQERAQLVVSELATNAIQASPGVAYGLRVSLAGDGSVIMAVTSTTERDAPPPRDEWGPAHPVAVRGRGLLIVDKLTDEVDVEQVNGTIVVRARLRSSIGH